MAYRQTNVSATVVFNSSVNGSANEMGANDVTVAVASSQSVANGTTIDGLAENLRAYKIGVNDEHAEHSCSVSNKASVEDLAETPCVAENATSDELDDSAKRHGLMGMPLEMIIEICNQHGDKTEIINMRRTNAAFFRAGEIAYGKAVACNRTVFPTSASISAFHALLDYWPWLSRHVRDVTLVGEGLRAHPFGSDWGWENVEHEEGVRFTDADYEIIHYANQEHTNEVALQGAFHVSGGYRAMLVGLFKRLPKLETINVRKLKVGEHIPGWNGPAALRDLSFYHPKLNTNDVYYGEWQYDDLHKRVTEYTDEYGELITEDGAGPQVFFIDDVILAMEAAGIPANINGSLH